MFAPSATSWALLAYISWTLLLTLVIVLSRTVLTLAGKRRSNSFNPDGADISPFFQRICRTHANCYEHFPLFGGLLLFSLATQQAVLTDGLAMYWFIARLGQSLSHLAAGSVIAVNARFSFFFVQLLIGLYWLYLFAYSA